MKEDRILLAFMLIGVLMFTLLPSCSVNRKFRKIQRDTTLSAGLSMSIDTSSIPLLSNKEVAKDTLTIIDEKGNEMFIMKAVRDEDSGDMVAMEELDAAVVTARFRNIAERSGLVDLSFQIRIPASLQDSKWQLRFFPDMYIMGDSVRLDPVVITGKTYNRNMLRGYQQYDKLIASIINDSTRFINLRLLELFMNRYLPDVYALKTDTSYVSDEQMTYLFGITQQQAIEHYTDKIARGINDRRIKKRNIIYEKYVNKINGGNIRLDTVMIESNGDFAYNYVQTIRTRPGLRKVDIVLLGEIYDAGKRIFTIPRSQPLSFYISSLSIFTQDYVRYVTKIVERKAEANTSCDIDFSVGKSNLNLSLKNNKIEIERIKGYLKHLISNDTFDLDSIVLTSSASPEGSYALNEDLSLSRGMEISSYFRNIINSYQDSLKRDAAFSVDEYGNIVANIHENIEVPFINISKGENWDMFYQLVDIDDVLSNSQKREIKASSRIKDLDRREVSLMDKNYYKYLREKIYPKMRAVRFDFYMHRKGMIKDTVHTTEIDSIYMRGIQALKDMYYDEAIELLGAYHDFNTAVAYMALNRNLSAMEILEKLEGTAEVNYLKAIIYSRMGDVQHAVESYILSCKQNHSYVYRGNLDPEISALIKAYGLNKDEDDCFDVL